MIANVKAWLLRWRCKRGGHQNWAVTSWVGGSESECRCGLRHTLDLWEFRGFRGGH